MNDLIVAPEPAMPATAPDLQSAHRLTPPQKAAIVLSVLDPTDAASLLKEFDNDAVLKFARAVSNLRPMPPPVLREVIAEFLDGLASVTEVRGGMGQVRSVLAGFMDDGEIDRIVNEITGEAKRPVWDRMNDAPPAQAATFLQVEHPQTISYILAKMKPSRAAAILEEIDTEVANVSVVRLARIPILDPEVDGILQRTIESEFLSGLSRSDNNILPEEVIGNLMNNVSTEAREAFLKHLSDTNAELANNVIKVMFTFADIAERVAPNEVTLFTKEVEEENLLIALKHAQETGNPTFEFIMGNLSKRLSERLTEEIEAMDAPKPKDAEAIQIEIVNIIQKKAKAGEMTLIEMEE